MYTVSGPWLESEDVAWFRDDLLGVRAAASRLAERVVLGTHRAGELALAVSEATSNLAKHAVAGSILLRVVRSAQCAGIEFLAMDDGPGIADVPASMRDGRSTTGTLGIGLGMIARLADTFDLHSIPGQGTVMLARFWPRNTPPRPVDASTARTRPVVEGLTRTISGGRECGDGWTFRWDNADQALLVMLCDGLGHGPLAQRASHTAIRAFRTSTSGSPENIMQDIHHALAATRGAAVAVARIEPAQGRVVFCGVGNIATAVVTPTSKAALLSLPGIAGHQIRPLSAFTSALPPGSTLVLHSDGLSERWNPKTFPDLFRHSAAVIAGHLLRSTGKHHDDASVAVAKGLW
ncbi:ATP-binding SpoIIE family protein phosphatase [Streptomyces sp. LRE541]|uniref:ATP-binding SpoIIE family protein phosphatase n=1 Tax=Streptomyces sp. LRE541 TaxID=2931983 RepID=UPI0024B15510|nr:ATP-binding SpoIIE family protein phosphatase [Streptomyces sp. LRE541]